MKKYMRPVCKICGCKYHMLLHQDEIEKLKPSSTESLERGKNSSTKDRTSASSMSQMLRSIASPKKYAILSTTVFVKNSQGKKTEISSSIRFRLSM